MSFTLENSALQDLKATFYDNWVFFSGYENGRNEFKKINLNNGKIVHLNSIKKKICHFL